MADISSDFREIVNHDVIPLFAKCDVRLNHVVEGDTPRGPKPQAVLGVAVSKHPYASNAFMMPFEGKKH